MVKKAVIPAAGLGTRMLPATKAIPKSMITIVDKPAIQYIVEEAVDSGITDILIIINPADTTVKNHFSPNENLENHLVRFGKKKIAHEINLIGGCANIKFISQPNPKGLGAAILLAKNFTGSEPFAVLYADDIIVGEPPATKQIITAYEKYNLGAVGIKEVAKEEISKYSSLNISNISGNEYRVSDMIEKPSAENALSLYSVMGRCVLPPEIYSILENTPAGFGGELQLTDAMKTLARNKGMIGVDFSGKRFDAGNKLDLLKCAIEVGKTHPEFGEQFLYYIKNY